MRYWLGVVSSKEGYSRLVDNDNTWWCGSTAVEADDRIFMYCAKALSDKNSGVFSQFQVVGPDPTHAPDCRNFGSTVGGLAREPISIAIVKRYTTKLQLASMKKDVVLGSAQFIRRNCQGTMFSLSKTEFSRILHLLSNAHEP